MWGCGWCGDVLLERRLSVRVVVLWNLLVEESALAAIIGRLRLVKDYLMARGLHGVTWWQGTHSE